MWHNVAQHPGNGLRSLPAAQAVNPYWRLRHYAKTKLALLQLRSLLWVERIEVWGWGAGGGG